MRDLVYLEANEPRPNISPPHLRACASLLKTRTGSWAAWTWVMRGLGHRSPLSVRRATKGSRHWTVQHPESIRPLSMMQRTQWFGGFGGFWGLGSWTVLTKNLKNHQVITLQICLNQAGHKNGVLWFFPLTSARLLGLSRWVETLWFLNLTHFFDTSTHRWKSPKNQPQ